MTYPELAAWLEDMYFELRAQEPPVITADDLEIFDIPDGLRQTVLASRV